MSFNRNRKRQISFSIWNCCLVLFENWIFVSHIHTSTLICSFIDDFCHILFRANQLVDTPHTYTHTHMHPESQLIKFCCAHFRSFFCLVLNLIICCLSFLLFHYKAVSIDLIRFCFSLQWQETQNIQNSQNFLFLTIQKSHCQKSKSNLICFSSWISTPYASVTRFNFDAFCFFERMFSSSSTLVLFLVLFYVCLLSVVLRAFNVGKLLKARRFFV